MYITSYKYNFERMLHFNTVHEKVCYSNNQRIVQYLQCWKHMCDISLIRYSDVTL